MDSQGRISEGEEGRTEEQRKQRNEKKSCFDGYFCRCLASSYKVYLTTLLRHSWAYNLGRSWANTITQPILWNSNQPLNSLAACYLLRVCLVMTIQPTAHGILRSSSADRRRQRPKAHNRPKATRNQKTYPSSARFFPTYLPVFKIYANNNSPWIYLKP